MGKGGGVENKPIREHIVTCQAHPVLIKKGESSMRFVSFLISCLGGYLACLLLSV